MLQMQAIGPSSSKEFLIFEWPQRPSWFFVDKINATKHVNQLLKLLLRVNVP